MSADSPEITEPAADATERRIAEEQLALLFRSNRRGLASTSIFGVALVLVLWGEAPRLVLGLWLTSLLGVVALRLALVLAYEHRAPRFEDLDRWRNLFTLGAAATGMLWGGALTVLFGLVAVDYQMVLGFVVIGMVSTAVGYLSAIPRVYILYALSALAPFALTLALRGFPYAYLAVFSIPFVGFLIATSLSLSRAIESSLRLGSERALLAERFRQEKERAESASRAKSEFLSDMAQELRTPLNAILGFAQLLELDSRDERSRGGAREIIDASQRLLRLVSDLLDLSRIESGGLDLSLRPCAVEELVSECVKLIRPLAQDRQIQIRDEVSEGPRYRAEVDPTLFKQALLHLLSNAVKYNSDRGSIRIVCGVPGPGRLRISVEDTGVGLTEMQQARLYTILERRAGDRKLLSGSGVGLQTTRRLADMMGGDLGFESQSGSGSRFWIEVRDAGPVRLAASLTRESTTLPDRSRAQE